jgi:selenocysteine-specific elongation factor
VAVRARPLGAHHARLRLDVPLPLRHGDRLVLRDPGSRVLWGVDVLDAAPPPLTRRGEARARAAVLDGWSDDVAGEVTRRGVVRRSLLRRLGVAVSPLPEDTLTVGDWLVSGAQTDAWRASLTDAVRRHPDGLSPGAAARAVGIPDPEVVPALLADPLRMISGRLVVESDLPSPVQTALDALRADLSAAPFGAPDAERLSSLGLDRTELGRLARSGHLLLVGDGVVLLPGADHEAYDVLAALDQPFTASEARRALGTSRRVVLPLLAHLDRTGRTVRLPDDTRRVVRLQPGPGA